MADVLEFIRVLLKFFKKHKLRLLARKGDSASRLVLSIIDVLPTQYVIYGGGMLCQKITEQLIQLGDNNLPVAVFDKNAVMGTFALEGVPFLPPQELVNLQSNTIVVASEKFIGDMIAAMESYIEPCDYKIITLFSTEY